MEILTLYKLSMKGLFSGKPPGFLQFLGDCNQNLHGENHPGRSNPTPSCAGGCAMAQLMGNLRDPSDMIFPHLSGEGC